MISPVKKQKVYSKYTSIDTPKELEAWILYRNSILIEKLREFYNKVKFLPRLKRVHIEKMFELYSEYTGVPETDYSNQRYNDRMLRKIKEIIK